MRRAIISVLVIGLVIGGLSPWALANRPGWIPDELKRGGGDDLESSCLFEPDMEDPALGISRPNLAYEPGPGMNAPDYPLPTDGKPASWFWWLLALSGLW